MKKYELIIPTVGADFGKLELNYDAMFRYLPVKKILVIGNEELRNRWESTRLDKVDYIDEDELVTFRGVKEAILKINKNAVSRTGWYLQQFLKMQYAFVCEDEEYLVWDSDMVPIKRISMTEYGKPCFDMSVEYNEPYFATLGTILPGVNKQTKGSFISEHMLISSVYMREMIKEIESNSCLPGERFYEKIINAVPEQDLPYSGFSEFETFGNYMLKKHPNVYVMRKWTGCRLGGMVFESGKISEKTRSWLSKSYCAVSFEKWYTYHPKAGRIYNSAIFQRVVSSRMAVPALKSMRVTVKTLRRIKRKVGSRQIITHHRNGKC